MRKILLVAGALVIIAGMAAALVSWFSYQKIELVNAAKVELSSVYGRIATNGKIEANQVYEIRAPFAATCRRFYAKEGDLLKAGQPILDLDDSALRSDLAAARAELQAAETELTNVRRGPSQEEIGQAEADVSRAKLELESAKKILATNEWLLQREAVSRFEVEQSQREIARLQQALASATQHEKDLRARFTEADRKRAASRLSAAGARIKYLEDLMARAAVRAPVDGTLLQFELKPGAFLNAGEIAGLLADITQLRVRVFVDEPDMGRLTLGSAITAHWDARPQDVWKGTIRRIPRQVVARGSRSVAEVLCSIDSPTGALIPNINVDVEIQTAEGPQVPSLPRSTVFPDAKGHFVWIIRDGQLAKRAVETGQSTSNRIQIAKGLATGDEVVVPGEAPLAEGMRVRVADK